MSFNGGFVPNHEADNPAIPATLVMKGTQMTTSVKKHKSVVVPASFNRSKDLSLLPTLPLINSNTSIASSLHNSDEGSDSGQHEDREKVPFSPVPKSAFSNAAKQKPRLKNPFRCRLKSRLSISTKYAPKKRQSEASNMRHLITKIRNSFQARPTRHNLINEQRLLKGAYILHPQATSLIIRQVISGAGILYSIIMVPLRLGFDYDAIGGWYYFELGVDIFFFIDILLSFRTAYFDDERVLIYSSRRIAIRYMKGSFVPDLLSTLPFDQLAG